MALFTSNFILRKDKQNSLGEHPIILTIYVSNQMRKLSTGINLRAEFWDTENKAAVFLNKKIIKESPQIPPKTVLTSDEVNEINDTLNTLRKTLSEKAKQFELEKVPFDVDMLVDRYKSAFDTKIQKVEDKQSFSHYLSNYLSDNGNILNNNTAKGYRSLLTHFNDFERSRGFSVELKNIDFLFMQSFYNYLIGTKKHLNVTAERQISKLKAIINYARKQGLEVSSSYRDYTIKKEEMEVIALNETEFQNIVKLDLTAKKVIKLDDTETSKTVSYATLDKARDIFIFSCMTGLRYSDLSALKRENIKNDFITLIVTKTKTPQQIPLMSKAKEVLSKYAELITPLPVISNQKLNIYIKLVAKLANVTEPIQIKRWSGKKEISNTYPKHDLISVHTGRKTFVTLSLAKGMNTELIMNITGHKSYPSFKRYLNITRTQTKDALLKAWE